MILKFASYLLIWVGLSSTLVFADAPDGFLLAGQLNGVSFYVAPQSRDNLINVYAENGIDYKEYYIIQSYPGECDSLVGTRDSDAKLGRRFSFTKESFAGGREAIKFTTPHDLFALMKELCVKSGSVTSLTRSVNKLTIQDIKSPNTNTKVITTDDQNFLITSTNSSFFGSSLTGNNKVIETVTNGARDFCAKSNGNAFIVGFSNSSKMGLLTDRESTTAEFFCVDKNKSYAIQNAQPFEYKDFIFSNGLYGMLIANSRSDSLTVSKKSDNAEAATKYCRSFGESAFISGVNNFGSWPYMNHFHFICN